MTKQKLGIEIPILEKDEIEIIRTTKESVIKLRLDFKPNRKNNLNTGIKFFNHMLDGIASRACFNLDVSYETTNVDSLDHVVVEDTGLTLGRAIREIIDLRRKDGLNERGFYTVGFDEALVSTILAFDGRAYTFLRGEVAGIKQEYVEDMLSTNLRQFFDGFSQGSGCVIQLQFWAGEDSHHTWEATFKSFGEALRDSLAPCPFRKGQTIGLKGTGMETKL
ncbi:hypothetical protein GF389_00235 [Candidatus Dojkabacteria bacterium]|nr:hypothetical protein [Candidatus Dojkabacteria bacterium]